MDSVRLRPMHPSDYSLYQLKIQRSYLERLLSKREYGLEKVNASLVNYYDETHPNLLSLGYHALSQLYRVCAYILNTDQKFTEIPFEYPEESTALEKLIKLYDMTLEKLEETKVIENYESEVPNPFQEGKSSVIWELIVFFTFHCQTHIAQLMRLQDLLTNKISE